MNKSHTFQLLCVGLILALTSQSNAYQDFFDDGPKVDLEANFQIEPNSRKGRLFVSASIEEGWNLYSSTQPMGGPKATRITSVESDKFQITGPFRPDEDPTVKYDEQFDMFLEEHKGNVIWSAPIELAEGVSAKDVEIGLKFSAQSCEENGSCILVSELLSAVYNGELKPVNLEATYEPKRAHVIWKGNLSTKTVARGDTVEVTLTAEPTEGYKIYGYEAESQGTVSQPTRIVLSSSYMWKVSDITPSRDPRTKDVDGETQKYYKDKVSWTMQLKVPELAAPGVHQFQGYVGFQNCTDAMCDPPGSAKFVFEIVVAEEGEKRPALVKFAKGISYGKVALLADQKAQEKEPSK